MSTKAKENFNNIVIDILNNEKFRSLDNELHHGISRYGHSLRVARTTYKFTKALNLDYVSATRAALLHDFYSDSDFCNESGTKKLTLHSLMAVKNAKSFYNISAKEENIIASHMFPLNKILPKHTESWVVTLVDKGVSTYEMYRFKFSLIFSIWTLFIFNLITLQK